MYCKNCYKDIPVGESYLLYEDNAFCCSECVTDYLLYRCRLSIETNTSEDEEE